LLDTLLIGSNSWLTISLNSGLSLIATTATLQAGGGITLDGKSPSPTGSGSTLNGVGGGGGHGGVGGIGSNAVAGGTTFDSLTAPVSTGGTGGNGTFFGNSF